MYIFMRQEFQVLIIRFNNRIAIKDIPLFRGAIIHAMTNVGILFHNHIDDKFRYSYPLIQYKRINQCAAIVCVNDGAKSIGDFFASCNFNILLGQREMILEVASMKANHFSVEIDDDMMYHYHICRWLPLNQENYIKYKKLDSLSDKYSMLEQLLTANILSFAKGINRFFDKQVICKITQMDEPISTRFKNIIMMGVDLEFKSNVSIPDFLGLGKGVSLGYGVVTKKEDIYN